MFRNRKRDRLKILWWDRDGLAIFHKRLERGRYRFPTDATVRKTDASVGNSQRCEIRSDELALLLEGIDLASVKRRTRYQRPEVSTLPTAAPA